MYVIQLNRTGGKKEWLLPSEDVKDSHPWTSDAARAKKFADSDHAQRVVDSLDLSERSLTLIEIVPCPR